MKNFTQVRFATITAILIFSLFNGLAQSPGQIVRRTSASTVLDGNGDSYVSLLTTGFTTNDLTQSEIPFKVIPLAFTEPVGDLATGQTGSFTDLVTSTTDNSGFMAYFDGTNLIFRLRVGSISSGAKAYSILIDADFKAGGSGSQADPNYVAPTSQGSGNIGFEWEVLLATGNATTVTVYETDGKTGPNIVQSYQTTNSNNWQISRALTTHSNNADYFYDFYVPLSVFTGTHAITASTAFRMAATTVNSPTSALTGSRSDIFGVNDVNYPGTPDGWLAALGATPPVTLNQLSSGSVGGTCTNAPVITSSAITIGAGMSVTGTWTRRDASMDANATITVYRYSSSGTLLNTYTSTSAYPSGVATGATWTITGVTAASGDYFVAKAKGTSPTLNESECLQSNVVYTACAATINPTILSQSSSKGICGSLTTGATGVSIYKMDATGNTLMNAGNANTTYTATTFTWFACSGGASNVANGSYMIVLTGGGCQSTPVYDCISSGASSLSGLATNTGITFPSVIYPFHTSITGTVPTYTSAQMATLFINNVLKTTVNIPANTTSYTFTGLQLNAGDNIKIYLSGNGCTVYNSATVTCYNQPPVITTAANGVLLAGATTISGTSAANATITLNKTNATVNSWTTTANSSGAWSVTVPALVAADTYTATVTAAGGCGTASAASPTTTVVAVTTTCPSISNTPVTNTPYTDTSTIVHGTVNVAVTNSTVRLYLDGALVGSQTLNATGMQNWAIVSSQPFYNGAVLKATFQSGSDSSERSDCGTSTVICAPPGAPSISPTSSTIYTGQNVTYSVSNVAGSTWYAVQDNTGNSYATSVYTSTGSNISLSTVNFSNAGTYNLLISADKLTGCQATTASASVVVNPIVTPVRFINVAAKQVSRGNMINWTVAEEANVSHYDVERSFDGRNFNAMGRVDYKQPSNSVNQYSFTDVTTNNTGKVFYRIKQVDNDGHYTLSSIVTINAQTGMLMQVWPNPANDQVNINITAARAQVTAVTLSDVNGRLLLSKQTNLTSGNNAVTLKELNRFAPGTYYLKVFVDGENRFHKVVIR
jgi:hypothetical protein